jgi:uncharacterized repeat protein (TIGR01451 family)
MVFETRIRSQADGELPGGETKTEVFDRELPPQPNDRDVAGDLRAPAWVFSPAVRLAHCIHRPEEAVVKSHALTPRAFRLPALIAGMAALSPASPALADILLNVDASPDPARAGELLDVEITVTNDGAFALTDVTVTYVHPENVNSLSEAFYDAQCPGNNFCEPGEIGTFTIATLPAGKGRTLSVPLRVANAALDGAMIDIDVEAFDDGASQAVASAQVVVDSMRQLELALVENRDPAAPSDTITYTCTYGVLSTSPGSPGATLELPLPPGTTFVSASDGGVLDGDTVTWALGNLNPGSTGERHATVSVDGIVAAGSILATEAAFADTASSSVTFESATRVEAEIPLELVVVANPDPVRPGETLDLELTVTNTGAFARSDVLLRLEIPDDMVSLSENRITGNGIINCPGNNFCEPQERGTFEIGTLAAGEGVTFTVPARMAGTTTDGTVASFEADVTDSTGDIRESGASLAVTNARVLELALTPSRNPVEPEDTVTYALTFGLLETATGAPGATLALPLPAGTTFVSASDGGTLDKGVVEWSVGNLNPGDGGERYVTVSVDAGTDLGSIVEASACFSDASSPVREVTFVAATRVQPANPLEIVVTASPDAVRPGETMDVEITVTNTGPFDRTGVVVTLEIPDGLTALSEARFFIGAQCPGNNFCEAQEVATIDIGTLAAGKGETLSVPFIVAGGTADGTVLSFEARVDDSPGDSRESGASVVVAADREFELTITDSDEPVAPGETFSYRVTYGTLDSGIGASNVTLSLALPEGAIYQSSTNCGTLVGDTVQWVIGNLNPGAGGERKAVLQLDPSVPVGTILETHAWIDDGSVSDGTMRTATATRVEVDAPLDVNVRATPDPVTAGEAFNVEVSVTNTTAFDRSDVIVWLEFPDGLTALNEALFGAQCPGNNFCEAGERAEFTIGTLAAGETMTYDVPPTVTAGTPDGTVLRFDVFATDVSGLLSGDSDAVMVGSSFAAAVNADLDDSGSVGFNDLTILLGNWGPCNGLCPADLDESGSVGFNDLTLLLGTWGPCV